MGIALIGVINNTNKQLVGCRIMDLGSCTIKDVPLNSMVSVLKAGTLIENCKLKDNGYELEGTNGALSRFPVIVQGRLSGASSIVILEEIGDLGYKVSDWKGETKNLKVDKVLEYANNNGIANGKLVTRDGNTFISTINGSYKKVSAAEAKEEKQKILLEQAVKLTAAEAGVEVKETPKLTDAVYSSNVYDEYGNFLEPSNVASLAVLSIKHEPCERLQEIDEKTGLSVSQKLARAVLVMQKVRSFYYSMYIVIEKKAIASKALMPTMGVSTDTLFFNIDFVKNLSMPELVFVNLHEVCHIAMRHAARRGDRNADIWNIAADMFINKMLCDEFGINYKGGVTHPPEDTFNVGIAYAQGGCYSDKVDIKVDTAESIYEELMKSYRNQPQQQGQGQSQKQEGQGQGQGQGSGEGEEGGQGEQGQGGGSGQGQEQGQEQGQGSGSGSGSQDGQQSGGGNGASSDQDIAKELAKCVDSKDITFKGDKITTMNEINEGKLRDLVRSEEEKGMSKEQLESKASGVLNRGSMHSKMCGGEAGGFLERLVADAIAPKVNWKSLVRGYLVKASQMTSSYSRPDKRFLSRGMILPGPTATENNEMEGLKVCIDTSGSISDEDLAIALKQMKQLLKEYKASAEMIYWDTKVRVAEPFTSVDEMLKVKPGGGGGTECNCIFEYFESKLCKIKPSLIIVFTDGYFGAIDQKYSKKYKSTIWVLNVDKSTFTKPFGKVADFK